MLSILTQTTSGRTTKGVMMPFVSFHIPGAKDSGDDKTIMLPLLLSRFSRVRLCATP